MTKNLPELELPKLDFPEEETSLEIEFEKLKKEYDMLKQKQYLEQKERELMYEDVHQLRNERDSYKNAFELLVKELKRGDAI